MSGELSAKDAILARIREGKHADAAMDRDYAAIPRTYQRAGIHGREECLLLLEERLREYDTGVYHAAPAQISETIAAILQGRNVRRLAIPDDLPTAWLPDGPSFIKANQLSATDLDRLDGTLSGCTTAIAFTGTIVLQTAARQGPRRLSLVPDYHLCVVFEDQVVETVSEAFDLLSATSHLPTTFISGPSATADIEMTRIRGVHGPRVLDVLLVR